MSTADTPGPKLIVGLANPGPDYEGTRHNIGWDVLLELASRALPMPASFQAHKRTNCALAQTRLADQAVVLARPRSYMNLSGGPVAAVAKYFSVAPTDVIVVHDEIDIDFGQVRLKRGGGEGGHNGLRSVTAADIELPSGSTMISDPETLIVNVIEAPSESDLESEEEEAPQGEAAEDAAKAAEEE